MGEGFCPVEIKVGVSKNRGTPKSSILIGVSLINHPFWGTTTFGNTQVRIAKKDVQKVHQIVLSVLPDLVIQQSKGKVMRSQNEVTGKWYPKQWGP